MKRNDLIDLWKKLKEDIENPNLVEEFDKAIKARKTSYLRVTIHWTKGSWSRTYIKSGMNELQEMEKFVFAVFHDHSVFQTGGKLPKVKTKRVYRYE